MNVILLGPAGSGKSTIASEFSGFLRENGYSTAVINLDPATPAKYRAHADIRNFVRAEEVMIREKLGINGALIRSMEIALHHLDRVVPDGEYDFVIYDTPGQLELFMYTDFGSKLIDRLEAFTAAVFIADASRITTPSAYSAMMAQSAVVTLMLGVPSVTAFNKSDIADVMSLEECLRGLEHEGVMGEFFEHLLRFVEATSIIYRPINVSATTRRGFDDLFSALNEIFCACGDLS